MNFKSFIEWLNESENSQEKELFGCIMMDAKIDNWKEYHLAGIKEEDIHLKPYDDSYGLEEQPHMTILYGIHEEEVDPQRIGELMELVLEPLILPVTEIGVFEGDEYDVVKYNLPITRQLQRYRDLFMKIPNTQKFPEYEPHMTICYVKPGEGKKYKTKLTNPFKVVFDKAVYSWHPNKDKPKSDDPDKTSRKVVNLKKRK